MTLLWLGLADPAVTAILRAAPPNRVAIATGPRSTGPHGIPRRISRCP